LSEKEVLRKARSEEETDKKAGRWNWIRPGVNPCASAARAVQNQSRHRLATQVDPSPPEPRLQPVRHGARLPRDLV